MTFYGKVIYQLQIHFNMENNKENQELATSLIGQYIQNLDYDRLSPALKLADYVYIQPELLLKGYGLCGNFCFTNGDFVQAIKDFNMARSFAPDNLEMAYSCFNALTDFYKKDKDLFIVNDLKKLLFTYSYFKKQAILNISDAAFINNFDAVINEINLRLKYFADDEVESRLSHAIDVIVDSFYQPKSYPEVLERFAFAIEDDLRDFYDEEKAKSKEKQPDKKKEKKKEDKADDDKK